LACVWHRGDEKNEKDEKDNRGILAGRVGVADGTVGAGKTVVAGGLYPVRYRA
jgi:hypothetical protein